MSSDALHARRAIARAGSRLAKDREDVKGVIIEKIEVSAPTPPPLPLPHSSPPAFSLPPPLSNFPPRSPPHPPLPPLTTGEQR